jgi:hypothetical protein
MLAPVVHSFKALVMHMRAVCVAGRFFQNALTMSEAERTVQRTKLSEKLKSSHVRRRLLSTSHIHPSQSTAYIIIMERMRWLYFH